MKKIDTNIASIEIVTGYCAGRANLDAYVRIGENQWRFSYRDSLGDWNRDDNYILTVENVMEIIQKEENSGNPIFFENEYGITISSK